jgi:sn-glycerol 3-phosphate transport system ATP-binding protein
MARAIVRNPRLFLMDEPLSNLDARLRSEVRDSIMDLHQQLKTSTVYVTHDQTEAMSMADRIVVMNGGHVQQVGRPEYLYANPANLFVAGFIGSPAMNLSLPCANGEVLLGEQRHPLPPRYRQTPGLVAFARNISATAWRRAICACRHRSATRTDGSRLSAPRQHPIGTLRFSRRHRGGAGERRVADPRLFACRCASFSC